MAIHYSGILNSWSNRYWELNPKRLVNRCLPVEQASQVVDSMTGYNPSVSMLFSNGRGFNSGAPEAFRRSEEGMSNERGEQA